ncbi:MAG: acyltransferase family protein [Chloroflexi bacterium]|nr:acyltransferase family protein [Chloroflexota bacterium]
MSHTKTTPKRVERTRLGQLDGLRGVAALFVLLSHMLRASGAWDGPFLAGLDRTPLHLLVGGREAVLLFFTLSGFVLALPVLSASDRPYDGYLVKRVFRIYVPYLAAVLLAFAGATLLARGHIPGMSDWFQTHWSHPPSGRDVANHVGMLGRFRSSEYGLSFWSLIHEMRVSIVFPLLVLPVIRWRTGRAALYALSFSIVGIAWASLAGIGLTGGAGEYAVTVHLIGIFLFSALLAKHREWIVERIRGLRPPARFGLAFLGAACYIEGRRVTETMGETTVAQALEHWTFALGAAVAIMFLLASARAARFFTHASLAFLGRISYSLYLLHGVVIYALVHTLSPYLQVWVILALALPAAILAGALSARYVEQPAMAMGANLSERLRRRPRTVAPRRLQLRIERSRGAYAYAAANRSSF